MEPDLGLNCLQSYHRGQESPIKEYQKAKKTYIRLEHVEVCYYGDGLIRIFYIQHKHYIGKNTTGIYTK